MSQSRRLHSHCCWYWSKQRHGRQDRPKTCPAQRSVPLDSRHSWLQQGKECKKSKTGQGRSQPTVLYHLIPHKPLNSKIGNPARQMGSRPYDWEAQLTLALHIIFLTSVVGTNPRTLLSRSLCISSQESSHNKGTSETDLSTRPTSACTRLCECCLGAKDSVKPASDDYVYIS